MRVDEWRGNQDSVQGSETDLDLFEYKMLDISQNLMRVMHFLTANSDVLHNS